MVMSKEEMGHKGAETANQDPNKKSEGSREAMKPREQRNPQEIEEAGRKGGEQSHGGGRSGESGGSNKE
jgi:general stress protein YciG